MKQRQEKALCMCLGFLLPPTRLRLAVCCELNSLSVLRAQPLRLSFTLLVRAVAAVVVSSTYRRFTDAEVSLAI